MRGSESKLVDSFDLTGDARLWVVWHETAPVVPLPATPDPNRAYLFKGATRADLEDPNVGAITWAFKPDRIIVFFDMPVQRAGGEPLAVDPQ